MRESRACVDDVTCPTYSRRPASCTASASAARPTSRRRNASGVDGGPDAGSEVGNHPSERSFSGDRAENAAQFAGCRKSRHRTRVEHGHHRRIRMPRRHDPLRIIAQRRGQRHGGVGHVDAARALGCAQNLPRHLRGRRRQLDAQVRAQSRLLERIQLEAQPLRDQGRSENLGQPLLTSQIEHDPVGERALQRLLTRFSWQGEWGSARARSSSAGVTRSRGIIIMRGESR